MLRKIPALSAVLAAAAVAVAALASSAPAWTPQTMPGLSQYAFPADEIHYVKPGGSWRPRPCWRSTERLVVPFEFSGRGMAKVADLGPNRQGNVFTTRAGKAVVWNMDTQRVRNYTDAPVLVALWCSRQPRPE